VEAPSAGEILVAGSPVPSLAGALDVAFIHQDLGLIDARPVLDNLRLGEVPLRRWGLLDQRRETAAAQSAMARVGLELPVRAMAVGALSPAEKTLVAVARALHRGATVLFVDEATSTLSPPDAQRVIAALRGAVAGGATVVMVSHKLSEVLDATGRVVVLLDGRIAADQQTAGLDRRGLVSLLAQHEGSEARRTSPSDRSGDVVLRLSSARAGRVGPVSLTVSAGEIVGLTGLPGSGLHDLAFLAHGALPVSAGEVTVAPGVCRAIVPPHRETQGGFAEMDVRANLSLAGLRRWRRRAGLLDLRSERADTAAVASKLGVQPAGVDARYGVLSGGNKQKVIFGRMLLQDAELCVLCEPTRGVDVQARSDIYRIIRRLRNDGRAVLITTSDAEDLFAVCDRVGVIDGGTLRHLTGAGEIGHADLEALL
jgi:ribose transport system ATP-binding protein